MALAALAIGGAIFGGISGAQKGKEAEDLMDREAELRWMATQEEVRRMEETHADIIGQARADVGASGFASSSESHQSSINEAESELSRQRSFTLMMGELQKDISSETADITGSNMMKSGATSGMNMGSSMGSWFS
ncbi:hypothetical protein VPHK225_0016 [Vibrio phage K225]|nr:hypothetical protein PODOV044v1_p0018 [Vibrio phage 23E28.1]QZI92073.1 hypothetical protein PODOV045v1_p0031 [Vibrio phage 69E27.1]